MAPNVPNPPISYPRLQEITNQACAQTFAEVTDYDHPRTEGWNASIINAILMALVDENRPGDTSADSTSGQPAFKYVVNSTIIQHAPTSSSGLTDQASSGRRGMHSASGAYWNSETDGMWSYKYSAAEKQGFDAVIAIFWVWVDPK